MKKESFSSKLIIFDFKILFHKKTHFFFLSSSSPFYKGFGNFDMQYFAASAVNGI